MTIDEAIGVLELHNQWRKGAEVEMQHPVRIGMAIDLVVCELKTLRKQPYAGSVCDECTAYPFDERGKTPLCKTCKDNPSQTVL